MKDGGRQLYGASEAVAGGETAGVHPVTLRLWADSGKNRVTWVGRERRFSSGDIDAMKVPGGEGAERPRLEGLYVRVSGATGQESSLDAQEAELRATAAGTVARVFRDRASGLREDRPGLEKLLSAAADRQVTVVRVTHEDRLARFGAFAGRLYGMRSAAARKRLPADSDRCPSGGVR